MDIQIPVRFLAGYPGRYPAGYLATYLITCIQLECGYPISGVQCPAGITKVGNKNEKNHLLIHEFPGYIGIEEPRNTKFLCIYWAVIQMWTCDEGNMEFYGSEATILTKAKPRSILLPKIYFMNNVMIHKTHIAQHHNSIFALLYVKCLLFKHIGLWLLYC